MKPCKRHRIDWCGFVIYRLTFQQGGSDMITCRSFLLSQQLFSPYRLCMGFLDLPFLSVDSTVIDLAAALDRSGKIVFKKLSCPAVPQGLVGSTTGFVFA